MTALLALTTVLAWGTWIPVAQAAPTIDQRTRTFGVAVGNLLFASVALAAGGGHLVLGWRAFWLPFAGGLLWTGGSLSAFRATEAIGLARAAGSWAPLNIVVAFVWGGVLFGELDHLGPGRIGLLAAGLVLVVAGVLLIVRSIGAGGPGRPQHGGALRPGLQWALAAGVLWGTYFVPAQWAHVPSTVANLPLALGIFVAALLAVAAAAPAGRRPPRPSARAAAAQLLAGVLFGGGNLALLGLVARVGTGVGFTVAQLSLLVNAGIGVWVFRVPPPGSRAARVVLAGVALAGAGGILVGTLR